MYILVLLVQHDLDYPELYMCHLQMEDNRNQFKNSRSYEHEREF
jgi:hypothetical protein